MIRRRFIVACCCAIAATVAAGVWLAQPADAQARQTQATPASGGAPGPDLLAEYVTARAGGRDDVLREVEGETAALGA